MTSVVYTSAIDDLARGVIDFESDAFAVLLVDSSYTPDKDAHLRRSDVAGEVSGPGYAGGGQAATVGVTKDLANDRVDIALGGARWPVASITAAGAVYYKARGGPASDDELVAFVDFGGDVTSTIGLFTVGDSTLRLQN